MFLETLLIIIVIFGALFLFLGIKNVPQSKVYLVERFGKYHRTLNAGLNVIIPVLDVIPRENRVDILERQLDDFKISVITSDNVEVELITSVFYRVIDAAKTHYRIRDIDKAIKTTAQSVVRSAGGKFELDVLQSSRDEMNKEIAEKLGEAADVWGVEITRTEVVDIEVDDVTKDAQRQQLNAERERRAVVAKAEGEKRSQELQADAELYKAQKEAEAIKVDADARAYSIKVQAEADAEQTRLIADAINQGGQAAVNFEIMKRQVDGLSNLAASNQTKTLVLPTDITKALGSLELLMDTLGDKKK